MTNLVKIQTISPGVLEMYHYIDRKFQASVALNISDCPDTQTLKDTVEDFRVKGISMIA